MLWALWICTRPCPLQVGHIVAIVASRIGGAPARHCGQTGAPRDAPEWRGGYLLYRTIELPVQGSREE